MARRYSGDLTFESRYNDNVGDYTVWISTYGKSICRVEEIKPPFWMWANLGPWHPDIHDEVCATAIDGAMAGYYAPCPEDVLAYDRENVLENYIPDCLSSGYKIHRTREALAAWWREVDRLMKLHDVCHERAIGILEEGDDPPVR